MNGVRNILLTSAGRRTSLLGYFLEAAHRREWSVFAADTDALAPALYLADRAFFLPPVKDPEYIRELRELVSKQQVTLIVPTIDPELSVLANSRNLIESDDCHVLVSSEEFVCLAGDKWLTVQAFSKRGIQMPRTWLPEHISADSLPEELFIRPRNGSASQHAYKTFRSNLNRILGEVPNPIVQEHISHPEITIDALLDFKGSPVHYVPRLRIRTLSGESIEGLTLPADQIHEWVLRVLTISAGLGARGPITLQAFSTAAGPILSEINPRFGGGFPLTYAAGGNYPDWILSMLEGKTIEPRFGDYRSGLYMTRSYIEHYVEQPLWNAVRG
jgi:carbamoyl-phosphate synthase large subunit